MSNLSRWSGRDTLSLREAMDRLVEDSFVNFNSFFGSAGAGTGPMVNVFEDADNVVVEAALPGIKPEGIEISVTGDVLTIKGEHKHEQKKKEGNFHRQEWQYASFQRSIALPVQVNPDAAHSEYENGVLTLTLPKAEAVKPRRLQIKTGK